MPNIYDVAQHAGVSTATVSRVLSQPDMVTQKTRKRVLQAIQQLGYKPNSSARNLRTLKTSKLLLTVPLAAYPLFGDLIHGAEKAAREAGYAVMLGETQHEPEHEDAYSMMLNRSEVDGIIFTSPVLSPLLAQSIALGEGRAPIVNALEFDPSFGVSSVHIDDAAAADAAISHLVELGHRRIGLVTGPESVITSRERLRGAREAMLRYGLSGELCVRAGDYTIESGVAAAKALIAEEVTAIFCFSDEMAIGALTGLREAGLSCPADISLVGFDGIRFGRFTDPPLTTIVQPVVDIGRHAARLLIETIAGIQTGLREVTLPFSLAVRGSTGSVR
jgi:LacI family repressor for deo operon, udp, cdd, tsx, nupC, and nupG